MRYAAKMKENVGGGGVVNIYDVEYCYANAI